MAPGTVTASMPSIGIWLWRCYDQHLARRRTRCAPAAVETREPFAASPLCQMTHEAIAADADRERLDHPEHRHRRAIAASDAGAAAQQFGSRERRQRLARAHQLPPRPSTIER